MTACVWVKTGLSNAFLPDGAKSSPQSILTYHQQSTVKFIWGKYKKKIPQPSINQLINQFNLNITYLKWVNTVIHHAISSYHMYVLLSSAPCHTDAWIKWSPFCRRNFLTHSLVRNVFTPQPHRAPGYCHRPSDLAVPTLTAIIFLRSFSYVARLP